MTIDADKDKQTHDGISVNANADRTPAGNVSTVTTNAVILDQMKEMFASAQKKSDEQGMLVASLAKQVETLTAKAKRKNPCGATRARSGRRLNFETPNDRATRADKDSSGQNPDEKSRQAHNQPRRTFHLSPGATKEAISSGSIWT
ncbi:hypothetical protein F2Q70_00005099 [Brassica cretica]|uniref:Uncharacterized protein n=1 Tax=Brassica cretica TaxID=69181 RepID=A0A8S9FS67_BRACR|nr:hypothetical protein F2Q68_00021757 [Brassica cretica]KAF2570095.1 hypothetical protein F2Q70_00005099 [Brassica cretica]